MSLPGSDTKKAGDGQKSELPKAWGALPVNASNDNPDVIDMAAYQQDVPFWQRVYRHSLTQMMLLSVQAFCGPAMSDAIAGLGGGGLATAQTSNIS